MDLQKIALRVAAKSINKPSFTLQLRDKGPSGRDSAFISWDKGWMWSRRDPKGIEPGFTRTFLEPEDILKDIDNYAVPNEAAKEATEYFQSLVEVEKTLTASRVAEIYWKLTRPRR